MHSQQLETTQPTNDPASTYAAAMHDHHHVHPCAEIIESATYHFVAQSWQWDICPHYGSLVTTSSISKPTTHPHDETSTTLYAIVYDVRTGSSDPIRSPFIFQKTEQELRNEQPHIFSFLKTCFSALVLGYEKVHNRHTIHADEQHQDGDRHHVQHGVPPTPAKMHSFVQSATVTQARHFFADGTYIPVIMNAQQNINVHELLIAVVRYQHSLNILSADTLEDLIRRASFYYGNDYRQLKTFVQRLQLVIDK